ncbi:MAG TPA: hypothetical protein VFE38_06040 [Edaphobacter sp.]|nr:hypothetical protein [Edaphobacter sp.]
MKIRSLFAQSLSAQIFCGLLIAVASLTLSSCHSNTYYFYKFPKYTFANRPKPPSKLAQRVMISYTIDGGLGGLSVVDAKRDIRSNVQNTILSFPIAGYAGGNPTPIFNFPEEVHGYVYSSTDGSLTVIDYSKEAASGAAVKGLTFPNASFAIPPTFTRIYAAEESAGQLVVADNTTGINYGLNLPGVYKVAANQGDTVVLALVRNSNTIYRLVRLNANQYPTSLAATQAIGAADCEPLNLPVYCIVPVNTSDSAGNAHSLDRPVGVYFSLDGTTADVLNCGPECGGTTASVTFLQQSALNVNSIPTHSPDTPSFTADVPVPGGVTVALSDPTTLYVAGQQQMPDGLFTGYLSTINLQSVLSNPAGAVTGKYSISDGNHTKLLFADDNTLWIGSQYCATGERKKLNQNYNCLTRFDRGAKTAQVVPNVDPTNPNSSVQYPNTNQNQYYYGDLTGLCWVQGFHKMYTAYGGQVHVFSTTDASEIDNQFVTVQGTALDVAYIDALTNVDN